MSEPGALAIANNDLVYLWWTFPSKIEGCLGFSIRRLQEGRRTVALPAFAHFGQKGTLAESDSARGTTDWFPIQSFQWKDLTVPEEAEVTYRIVPMTGTPGERLTALEDRALETRPGARLEAGRRPHRRLQPRHHLHAGAGPAARDAAGRAA